MTKRVLSLLLTLMLLATTALAQESAPPQRSKTYGGEFSDLAVDSPFYSNVAALYEYGLSVGKADGTFGLQDHVTVGQAVIFASRVRSLYLLGDAEVGARPYHTEGQAAYLSHLAYLQFEGVLGRELDGFYTAAATRAQTAHILSRALPEGTLPLINSDPVNEGYATRRYITDITEYTPYQQDILFLYRTGISQGSNADGAFLPEQPLTRGALAAMLTRMVDPSLRITLDWSMDPVVPSAPLTLAALIPAGEYIPSPATYEEMDSSVRSMLAAGQNTLTLHYDNVTSDLAGEVMLRALQAVKTYCEQCYNSISCTYFPEEGKIDLTFSAASAGDRLAVYREETMRAAVAVHDQLWREGILTPGMSDLDKAHIYFDWICDNCVYDYDADDRSLSHIAYSLFSKGTAVCDGYTGAYNLLLKLEGISCTALSTATHIWTVAELDGTLYHIDTTWADTHGNNRDRYFAMTPEASYLYHPW